MEVTVTVNGTAHTHDVEPRTLLVHFIRENVGLTGTNIGCDTTSCGACSIHLNGEAVKSCTVLAVQADGMEVGEARNRAVEIVMEALGERRACTGQYRRQQKKRHGSEGIQALTPLHSEGGIFHHLASNPYDLDLDIFRGVNKRANS